MDLVSFLMNLYNIIPHEKGIYMHDVPAMFKGMMIITLAIMLEKLDI